MGTAPAPNSGAAKKHDWALFFGGLLVFLMGLAVMLWPGLSMVTLAIMAGIILVVSGIANIVSYTQIRGAVSGAGWTLATGICDLLLGALFIIYPVATAAMLPWLAGVFVIAYSVFAIIAAIGMKKVTSSWGWVLATGIVGLLCGIMFIGMPDTFVIFLGIFLLMRGTTMAITGLMAPNQINYM